MFDIAVERLRRIPIRRSDEVWEVAAMPLPKLVRDADRPGHAFQIAACACVSSRGGAMISEMQRVDAFEVGAPLEAISRFASDPHRPDVPPIGYLPGRVVIGPMPDMAQEYVANALTSLGIEVEFKETFALTREFMAGLLDHIKEEMPPDERLPFTTPGIMRAKGMTIERVRAFAHAARMFWKAAPWRHFEGEVLWSIEPRPKLKPLRHVVVMGGAGEEPGLGFLSGPEQLLAMLEADDPEAYFAKAGETHWSVGYGPREEIPLSDVFLWMKERLVVAAEDAYPFPHGITRTGRISRPNPESLTLMEGLLRLFAETPKREFRGDLIWRKVETSDGDVWFHLQAVVRL